MTGRLLGVFEDGSPEWHAARARRIGASDIGVICGWSPFRTRADLLAEKRGETAPRPMSDAMARGHYLEPAIAAWFADETGADYDAGSDGTYVHPDHDHHLANPDRICTDGSVLEVKTSKEKTVEHGWGRAGTSQVPITYAAQCQWLMHVLGLDLCHVAVLFGAPFKFCRYRVKRDDDVIAYLIRQADAFHTELTEQRTAAA